MIYLDNAATSWPKPDTVAQALKSSLTEYGANPGRGGYEMAQKTATAVFQTREKAAEMFAAGSPDNVMFTKNCTEALNAAIKCYLPKGGHVIISDREHNSVTRTLEKLQSEGRLTYSAAKIGQDSENAAKHFASALKAHPRTKMLLSTHRSNVDGTTLPIKEIGETAEKHGVIFCVDGAQTAGSEKIDMTSQKISLLALPGHKGLYGPPGTGMLLQRGVSPTGSLLQGGTGSMSTALQMPDFTPDALEAGTLNTAGIIALGEGMRFVTKLGEEKIGAYEKKLAQNLKTRLKDIQKIKLYSPSANGNIVLFNIEGVSSEHLAGLLSRAGICVRGGLHCAPPAHKLLNTLTTGAVRASLGVFNNPYQIAKTAHVLERIAKQS